MDSKEEQDEGALNNNESADYEANKSNIVYDYQAHYGIFNDSYYYNVD